MQPREFDRLTENIRIRGQVESLPYCHQPGGTGVISIISGHHRVRAARAAGLTEIPVIIDTREMRRSEIVAKQIAHNELHGTSDETVLATLVAMMDNVDDMLMSGLDENALPTMENDDTHLLVPAADFDWRTVTLMFLPSQVKDWSKAVMMIEKKAEVIGVASIDQFEQFAQACADYGRTRNVKSMVTTITVLTKIAQAEIEKSQEDGKTVAADVLGLGRFTEDQAAQIRLFMDHHPSDDPAQSLVDALAAPDREGVTAGA